MQTINISIDIPVGHNFATNDALRNPLPGCLSSSMYNPRQYGSVQSDSTPAEKDIKDFCRDIVSHVFFSRPTKNNVIDGTFTKIMMAFPYVTTVGLYINSPIVAHRIVKDISKTTIFSSKFSNANLSLFRTLSIIECQIIDKFKASHNSAKTAVYALREHLYNSSIKIFNNRESANPLQSGVEDAFFEIHNSQESATPDLSEFEQNESSSQESAGEEGDLQVGCSLRRKTTENEAWSLLYRGDPQDDDIDDSHLSQLIRISGVWESSSSVGIIYKFLETESRA
jgi:hypothetical protein